MNIHIQCIFADTPVCSCHACPLPQPPHKGIDKWGGCPPLVKAAEGHLLYMVAWEVASIAKTYRRISKYALNMYIDACISHIPLESLSS